MYNMKDMLPSMPELGGALNSNRLMGKSQDSVSSNETVRPGKITAINEDAKTVTVEWLDYRGGQGDVVLNFPHVSATWGMYFCPEVNDFVSCAFEKNKLRILTWVPRNVSKLRKLKQGEIMLESSTQATIYFDASGRIYIASAPERDPDKSDQMNNVPDGEIIVGTAPSPYGGDKQYQMQLISQSGGRITFDTEGNVDVYGSGSATGRTVGQDMQGFGGSSGKAIQENDFTTIEGDKEETIKCTGTKKAFSLTVGSGGSGDYNISVEGACNLNVKGKCNISAKKEMSFSSSKKITMKAPKIELNPSSGAGGFGGIGDIGSMGDIGDLGNLGDIAGDITGGVTDAIGDVTSIAESVPGLDAMAEQAGGIMDIAGDPMGAVSSVADVPSFDDIPVPSYSF